MSLVAQLSLPFTSGWLTYRATSAAVLYVKLAWYMCSPGGRLYQQNDLELTTMGFVVCTAEPPASHSLELYDIRATSSFSSCDAGAAGACSSTAASKGLWSAEPVMSLPVPNRVTCFQVCVHYACIGVFFARVFNA